MDLKGIFDVFSRRHNMPDTSHYAIPNSTRNRVFLWCAEVFANRRSFIGGRDCTYEFWQEIHRALSLRHGLPRLSSAQSGASSVAEDAVAFLSSCDDAEFLDFLEYIFRVDCFFHVSQSKIEVVAELNELLRADNLPYHLTDFVERQVQKVVEELPFFGQERTVIETLAYPTIISRENEVVHARTIEPALKILQSPLFKSANEEYLDALEDYRKVDFGDCLVKCASAFESVMKIICHEKNWPCRETDTARTLVNTILKHSNLENYFEPMLMIVATLRNRLSKAHGAGKGTRRIPRHIAAYALNTTAACILLLAGEAGLEGGVASRGRRVNQEAINRIVARGKALKRLVHLVLSTKICQRARPGPEFDRLARLAVGRPIAELEEDGLAFGRHKGIARRQVVLHHLAIHAARRVADV